jgi:hypothetical protein
MKLFDREIYSESDAHIHEPLIKPSHMLWPKESDLQMSNKTNTNIYNPN